MLNQPQQNYGKTMKVKEDENFYLFKMFDLTDERTTATSSHSNGGDLSPTSNQLARWFSPTLLERARAGKLPNMPSAGSLEEIERQTAAPVHN